MLLRKPIIVSFLTKSAISCVVVEKLTNVSTVLLLNFVLSSVCGIMAPHVG